MNSKRITCFITYTIQEREIEHTLLLLILAGTCWLNEDLNMHTAYNSSRPNKLNSE